MKALRAGDHLAALERCQRRMDLVDTMAPELRACVHDFGLTVVKEFLAAGVTDPRKIRTLVRTVYAGSIEIGDREVGPKVSDGEWTVRYLNDELSRHGLPSVGRHLLSALKDKGRIVVPRKPTRGMIDASIDALRAEGVAHVQVAREDKHRIRLRRALAAGSLGDDT